MPRVRVACPSCGVVDVDRDALTAHVTLGSPTCSYRFACPCCAGRVERRCPSSTVDLLVDCGVSLVVTAPGPPCPAAGHPSSPAQPPAALVDGDVARFQALLADDAALAAAVEGLARP